jgi:hypothetical protein
LALTGISGNKGGLFPLLVTLYHHCDEVLAGHAPIYVVGTVALIKFWLTNRHDVRLVLIGTPYLVNIGTINSCHFTHDRARVVGYILRLTETVIYLVTVFERNLELGDYRLGGHGVISSHCPRAGRTLGVIEF